MLGPLIFLVLVGDIDNDTSSETKMKSFADDTRATRGVASIADTICLQEDLNKVYAWSDAANMKLNNDKFEALRYGDNKELKESTTYTTPSGKPIEVKSELKDLGVIMSDDCQFNKQIESVVEKAKNMSSWILRTFKTRARVPMLTLYKSLVLPILEYCSVLWCPLAVGNIQKLEAVQWSFIRKIIGTRGMDYWQRLKELKLYSLERRRERYRILYTWKVLENLVPNVNDGIISYTNPRQGRKCIIPTPKRAKLSKTRDSSFNIHALKLFNALPRHIRNASSISLQSFKRAVDLCLREIPDEPQLPNYTICRRAPSNSIIHMILNSNPNTESCPNNYPGTDTTARRDCHNTVA